MTPDDFLALGTAAQQAVLAAALVRNGIEDLHAGGAFEDSQAPSLNRIVRQELLQVCTSAELDGAVHSDYVIEVAADGSDDAGDDFRLQCLTGAAARALWVFADREGLDDETAEALVHAAQAAICDQEEERALLSPMGSSFLFSYISAWEPPELSDEYRARVGLT